MCQIKQKLHLSEEIPNITRCHYLEVLGVTFTDRLKMDQHIRNQLKKSNGSLCVIKIIKSHGASPETLHQVYTALILNRLLYAAHSWWGFVSTTERKRIANYVGSSLQILPGCQQIDVRGSVEISDKRLFKKTTTNRFHVLQKFFPSTTNHNRNLRQKGHSFQRSAFNTNTGRNFITRMLHADFLP